MPDAAYQAALERCRNMITVGSKSFSLAARLFGADTRDAAFCLYGWCRHCDDEIDVPIGSADASQRQLKRLERLVAQTRSAYAGDPQEDPVFLAFQHVTRRYGIPAEYPLELLEGMAMDVRCQRYKTVEELLVYCYRVAGTVGLMMSHIMGLSSEKALENAAHMGMAMQLTNIARDVLEDAGMGRVYLPTEWLESAQIPVGEVAETRHRKVVAALVARLLDRAEELYRSGDAGLICLPFRATWAISAARRIYSEIGVRVRVRGSRAWDTRTVVPLHRKFYVMGEGILRTFTSLPARLFSPWKPAAIHAVWRIS